MNTINMKKNILRAFVLLNCISAFAQKWHPVGTNADAPIYATLGDDQSKALYVGGNFSNIGGVNAAYIARWDGSNWNAMGTSINGMVTALAKHNGSLYIAGDFSFTSAAKPVAVIAQWGGGNKWYGLGDGIGGGTVSAMATYNGELIVAGSFTDAGGLPVNNIAKWNGNNWSTLSSGIAVGGGEHPEGFLSNVYSLLVHKDTLYAFGWFVDAGADTVNSIAKWNGTKWEGVGGGVNAFIFTSVVYNDEIYVGGLFDTIGGQPIQTVSRWDGKAWKQVGKGFGTGIAQKMIVHEGSLYVGGRFADAGGKLVENIARWDGNDWYDVGNGCNDIIGSMTTLEGSLYAGGLFTAAGGDSTISFLARYGFGVGINDPAKKNQQLTISPNPVTSGNLINIINTKDIQAIQLYDLTGKVLRNEKVLQGSNIVQISTHNLPAGLYFIKAGDKTQKIIIQ